MQLIDIDFFPTTNSQTLSITNEDNLTPEMHKYLKYAPTKGRLVDEWIWNAPNNIKRNHKEHGYAFAYKEMGYGHWLLLYWNHVTGEWHKQLMGGQNGWMAQERYDNWLKKGFENESCEILLPMSLKF